MDKFVFMDFVIINGQKPQTRLVSEHYQTSFIRLYLNYSETDFENKD